MTLVELQAELARRGHSFAVSTLWRFFDRHGITWKKRPRTPQSRIGRTS
jgi:transposase